MDNKPFWRALHSLAHPVSMAAIVTLLLNDHWLRHEHPAWWTGKLGDLAWLVFAPCIAALIFAWIVPRRHHDWVGPLAFGFIGIWFATAKTIAPVHELTTTSVEAIIGWEGTLHRDVTDLLTLPGMLVGWWVWRGASDAPRRLAPVVPVVLMLGVVGTLASTEPYYANTVRGITCINVEQNGTMTTFVPADGVEQPLIPSVAVGTIYTSNDGGLTWSAEGVFPKRRTSGFGDIPSVRPCSRQTVATVTEERAIQYRYEARETIEQSTNNGQTWNVIYDVTFLDTQARHQFHLQKQRPNTLYSRQCTADSRMYCTDYVIEVGPHDVKYHPATGNVVFAMGWDGVLVYRPDGEWQWVAVSRYYPGTLPVHQSLAWEIWMALALGCLVFLAMTLVVKRDTALLVLTTGGGILWIIARANFLPDDTDEWSRLICAPLYIGAGLLLAVLVFDKAWRMRREQRQAILPALGIGMVAAIVFFLPYWLWFRRTVPRYETASRFALMLAAGAALTGFIVAGRLRRQHLRSDT